MKSFTYAAIAVFSAVVSAQQTTSAPSSGPGWNGWFDGDGDGNSGPGPFGGRLSLDASQQSIFNSFTSAHPTGPSDSAAWASLTSALSLTGPPSGAPSFVTNFGPGGWGYGSGNGGWGPGGGRGGPFGGGAHGGWGADDGEFCSTGSWTAGPWTSWWGGDRCPNSNWPGWTTGSWASNADWTTWAGCSATVTATSVFTTIPANGTVPVTSTSFGYQVAQATNSLVSTTAQEGAAATHAAVAGGVAAGAIMGVIAML